jgi:hypothetical protein
MTGKVHSTIFDTPRVVDRFEVESDEKVENSWNFEIQILWAP